VAGIITLTWHNDLFAFTVDLKETGLVYALPIKHVHGLSLSFKLTLHSLYLALVWGVYN